MQVKEITTAIEKLIFGKYIRKIRLSYRKLRDLHSTSNASCASDMWHRESHQSPKLTFIPKLSRSQNNQSEPCAPLWTGLQWSELKKKRGETNRSWIFWNCFRSSRALSEAWLGFTFCRDLAILRTLSFGQRVPVELDTFHDLIDVSCLFYWCCMEIRQYRIILTLDCV